MEIQIILTKQDFESIPDNGVTIHFSDDYILKAEVISIKEGMPFGEGIRTPFSIVFRTAQKNEYFDQGTYPIIHPSKGSIPVFLVPIGPDENGMKYEAVFN
jgi:hypothetical protein